MEVAYLSVPMLALASAMSGPDVLADELHHALEQVAALGEVRRLAGLPFHVDVLQGDGAAGLAVGGAEALRLVAIEARLHVLVVVLGVAVRLVPDGRRRLHGLAALQR